MEFHQIRYFVAVATTLNFTRAAELCCISQPALSRAIKLLEEEMGGPLLTRERHLSHLTELGHRLLPMLQQCYKTGLAAKALARDWSDADQGAIRLALVGSVELDRIARQLGEVITRFPNVDMSVKRGSKEEVLDYLKSGEANFGISDSHLEGWERLDSWLIDKEPYCLVANERHDFASCRSVPISALASERLICLPYCTLAKEVLDLAHNGALPSGGICEVDTLADIFTLLSLNGGVALLPRAARLPEGLVRVDMTDAHLDHSTCLYAVAGRRRGRAATAFVDFVARTLKRRAEAAHFPDSIPFSTPELELL